MAREALFNAMQLLGDHDVFNTNFNNYCIYASRFKPISAGPEYQQEVRIFELSRAQYLKCVLSFAREHFYGEVHAEQKLFELAERTLRAIDPALIGESRYDSEDWFYTKIYKTASHFFWGQLYMWGNRNEVRAWAARYDILKWGAKQDPNRVFQMPIDHYGFDITGIGFIPKTTLDQIISELCLKELGFEKEDIEPLQTLFQLFPGVIEKFSYHPSTKQFRIALQKDWKLTIDWDKVRERFFSKLKEQYGVK